MGGDAFCRPAEIVRGVWGGLRGVSAWGGEGSVSKRRFFKKILPVGGSKKILVTVGFGDGGAKSRG
jgi:hypothetical protein